MSAEKHHIISLRTYLLVFVSLIIFTFITIVSTYIDLGSFNIVLALLIASFKSSLVLLFFMHLYYDNKINLAFIIGSFLFLAIFIGLTMIDTTRRADIYDKREIIHNNSRSIFIPDKFYKNDHH